LLRLKWRRFMRLAGMLRIGSNSGKACNHNVLRDPKPVVHRNFHRGMPTGKTGSVLRHQIAAQTAADRFRRGHFHFA
jgi:hypothetical protein